MVCIEGGGLDGSGMVEECQQHCWWPKVPQVPLMDLNRWWWCIRYYHHLDWSDWWSGAQECWIYGHMLKAGDGGLGKEWWTQWRSCHCTVQQGPLPQCALPALCIPDDTVHGVVLCYACMCNCKGRMCCDANPSSRCPLHLDSRLLSTTRLTASLCCVCCC
jgi:hypothetical protein